MYQAQKQAIVQQFLQEWVAIAYKNVLQTMNVEEKENVVPMDVEWHV